MVRSFDLRDLALVRRLSEQGVSLHTESALTHSLNPLRGALLSLVGGNFPTFVWKLEKGEATGFIQLYLEQDKRHARILFVGSDTAVSTLPNSDTTNNNERTIDEAIWLPLLDQAVVEIGRRGIHSLVAEVSETGPELPVLRRAGFAVFTRQDIFRLKTPALPKGDTAVSPPHHAPVKLRPRRAIDDWDVQLLYGNIVPRLVQLVEPAPPFRQGEGWLLHENDELAAFAYMRTGSAATWMRLFIHPIAEERADAIVAAAVQVATQQMTKQQPIYCCVRRYQSWLQGAMERAGFDLWGGQAVMVKHTVHHSTKPLPELSTVLDGKPIPASAPMVRHYKRKEEWKIND